MKKNPFNLVILALLILAPYVHVYPQEATASLSPASATRAPIPVDPITIEVDCKKTLRTFSVNPVGFCVSFINDGDTADKQSLAAQLKSINVGSLRFPEGALAESYLFHDLRKGAPEEGHLQPIATSLGKIPNRSRWLQDEFFIPETLDFDEFMTLCQKTGAEPIVIVSAKGNRFRDSQSDEETLLRNAEEWVRYANVTRKLGVKYWEIGNEVDLMKSQKVLSMEEYLEFYRKVVTRMKAVDPTIHTGLGTGGGSRYTRAAMGIFPELVDFVVIHKYASEITTYKDYLNTKVSFFNDALGTLKAIDELAPEARRKQTEILITEFSSFSWVKDPPLPPERRLNSIMNAMLTFEMMAQGVSLDDRVRTMDFWITRNPWSPEGSTDFSNALDPKNEILPQGRGVEMMSRFVRDKMVGVTCPPGPVRCWASTSHDTSATTVWLINRDQQSAVVELKISGTSGNQEWSTWALNGTNPNDTSPTWGASQPVTMKDGSIKITVPPLSITAIYKEKRP